MRMRAPCVAWLQPPTPSSSLQVAGWPEMAKDVLEASAPLLSGGGCGGVGAVGGGAGVGAGAVWYRGWGGEEEVSEDA